MRDENIWRELCEEWRDYVAERRNDYLELQTITLKDGDFLAAMGIDSSFPWFEMADRGSPLIHLVRENFPAKRS